jgi:hypothetical protein
MTQDPLEFFRELYAWPPMDTWMMLCLTTMLRKADEATDNYHHYLETLAQADDLQ